MRIRWYGKATLKESGLYVRLATRSSAANIPVNLSLCERLGLNEDTFHLDSIGRNGQYERCGHLTAVLSLAAAHTLGISVDLPTAVLLCIVSAVGACGASGVAGGSLLLIPVACASFGICAVSRCKSSVSASSSACCRIPVNGSKQLSDNIVHCNSRLQNAPRAASLPRDMVPSSKG